MGARCRLESYQGPSLAQRQAKTVRIATALRIGDLLSGQGMTHTLGGLRSFSDAMHHWGLRLGNRDFVIELDSSPHFNATGFLLRHAPSAPVPRAAAPGPAV